MPAAIFNSQAVKILKNILAFNSQVRIITGDTDDPTTVAKDAPISSLYLRSGTSSVYIKVDAGSSTNWNIVSTGAAGANTTLSNLGVTSINNDLLPNVDSGHRIGSSSLDWNELYVNRIYQNGLLCIDVEFSALYDGAEFKALDFDSRRLVQTDGTTEILNWASGFTVNGTIKTNADVTNDLGEAATAFKSAFLQDIKTSANSIVVDVANSRLKSGSTTKLDWSGTDVSLNTRKLTSVTDPSSAQDAATKNYVDGFSIQKSAGDIKETSFSAANNQVTAADVTGFAFANGTVRSFQALVSVSIDATTDLFEVFELSGIQVASAWYFSNMMSNGDDSGITFTITTAGQIQYTSTNVSGFASDTIKFRAITTTV